MKESLENALCGLDGKNLVTEEIAHLLSSIKEDDIPDCWDGVAYPTLDNLEDFVRDLVSAKCIQFQAARQTSMGWKLESCENAILWCRQVHHLS